MIKRSGHIFALISLLLCSVSADEYDIEETKEEHPQFYVSPGQEDFVPSAYRHCHHYNCRHRFDCYRDQDAVWPGKLEDSFHDALTH